MAPDADIAIIGLAARLPGADDVEAFWVNLCQGVESISRPPDTQLRARGVPEALIGHPHYVKAVPLLDGAGRFDAAYFGMTADEARLRDPQHRLWLEACQSALEDAAYGDPAAAGRVGMFVAAAPNGYAEHHVRPALAAGEGAAPPGRDLAASVALANDSDHLSSFASGKLGLDGPRVTVPGRVACSLAAVHLACLSLRAGDCDLALAGGVHLALPYGHGYRWLEGGTLSPDGHCRPFDAEAAGTVHGSGVGVVVLRRLGRALAAGDSIRAVIRGSAVTGGGERGASAARARASQAAVVRDAMMAAELGPQDIGFVEADGTGVPLADSTEAEALRAAWRALGNGTAPEVLLGSVKGNVGHAGAAAGVTGLVKAVLAVQRGVVPGTGGFRRLHPRLDGLCVHVSPETQPFPGTGPRRAAVSSSAGANAHLVVEQTPAPEPAALDPAPNLVVLSAASPEALGRLRARLADTLQVGGAEDLASVGLSLRQGRRQLPFRLAVGAADRATAAARLRKRALPATPATSRQVALLLPGEGVQFAGMGRGLYRHDPAFREAFDECAEAFARAGTRALHELARSWTGLHDTEAVQPALLAVQYATVRALEARGTAWSAVLGHSYGEVVALVLAGVLGLGDAAALVWRRARLMQACEPGRMLAVALPATEAGELGGGGCTVAALNGPARTVLSGPPARIEAVKERLDRRGVRCRLLATSHAFHSPSMEPAAEALARVVARHALAQPSRGIVSTVTGGWLAPEEARDPELWAAQLRRPVRWWQALQALLAAGDWVLVDVGPTQTASSLAREHPAVRAGQVPLVPAAPLSRVPDEEPEQLLEAAGRVWEVVADVTLREEGLPPGRRVPLPTYPFGGEHHWMNPPGVGGGPAAPAATPGEAEAVPGEAEAAPGGELQRLITDLWRRSLDLSGLGPDDHVFDLGANSLTALEVVDQIQDATGIEVSLITLFEHPTARALAARLQAELAGQPS